MLNDSKTKVEVLRMRLLRAQSLVSVQSPSRQVEDGKSRTPEGRVAMLRYRIDVESRLLKGAKSIMKANPDKKSWQSVSPSIFT